MAAGLNITDFNTMFPEFSAVSAATTNLFISLINNGYQLISMNVTDASSLAIYYWLLAHFVASATNPMSGTAAGSAGNYMPISSSTGLVSMTFEQLQNFSADQSFMTSTRYGQVYYTFSKQVYLNNFYINPQWC